MKRKGQGRQEARKEVERSEMKVPILSSPLLLSARQAGGMGHCLHPSEGGPRIQTGR